MKITIISIILFCCVSISYSQNIGIGTNIPHTSAALEVKDSARGFLPPRMTYSQRIAILNPAQGLIIYCTNCGVKGQAQIYDGTNWTDLSGGFARGVILIDTINNTTKIGSKIWSTKNLSVNTYRNGDTIPEVRDPNEWRNLTTGAWCWYNNDSISNESTYGKLYNWYAVNDPRGLAPQGWHVPSDFEWTILETNLGGPSIAGGAMKNITGWNPLNYGASNSSGFSALPGGYRYTGSVTNFTAIQNGAIWWSSGESDSTSALRRNINYESTNLNKGVVSKKDGYYVRVVKD